jgi:hypothetical protein
MPKIAIYKFLTFFIFAYDALNEPPHLHIVKEKGNRQRSAKIWLETFKVAEKGTLNEKELNQRLSIRIWSRSNVKRYCVLLKTNYCQYSLEPMC